MTELVLLEKRFLEQETGENKDDLQIALDEGALNASGHRDQLQRGYGFFSICGLALNVDVAWIALGTSYVN